MAAGGAGPRIGSRGARIGIWIAFVVLFVLHQDWWLWDDRTLVFGFLPSGLAYHATYSLVAAGLWWVAISIAWPGEFEAWADAPTEHETGAQD